MWMESDESTDVAESFRSFGLVSGSRRIAARLQLGGSSRSLESSNRLEYRKEISMRNIISKFEKNAVTPAVELKADVDAFTSRAGDRHSMSKHDRDELDAEHGEAAAS